MSNYKVQVDLLLCQGHGVCSEECPEVFEVVEMETGYPKVRVKKGKPGGELRQKVEDAVRFCPNGTIRLVELD